MVDAEFLTPLIAAGAGFVLATVFWIISRFKMDTTKKVAEERGGSARFPTMKRMANTSGITLGVTASTLALVITYTVLLAGAGRINHNNLDEGEDVETGDRVNVEWIRYAAYTLVWPTAAWLIVFVLRDIAMTTSGYSLLRTAINSVDYGDWPIAILPMLSGALFLIGSLLPNTDSLFWIPVSLAFLLMALSLVIVVVFHGFKGWHGMNSFLVFSYIALTAWLLILIALSTSFGGVITHQTTSRWLFAGTDILLYVVMPVVYLAWNMRYLVSGFSGRRSPVGSQLR